MYKKILLPVSGENNCERAKKALKKARIVSDGEIILLHVTEPIPQVVGGEARAELERECGAKGLAVLRPIIEELELAGLPFHTRVVSGTAADTILRVAAEEKVDLIVMFTDGRDGLSDMLLGSITERVLRSTEVDILAVKK